MQFDEFKDKEDYLEINQPHLSFKLAQNSPKFKIYKDISLDEESLRVSAFSNLKNIGIYCKY